MTTPQTILDTDILSAIMRQHPVAVRRARAYLATYGQLTLSLMSRYEILRGLHAKRAESQLARFDRFCAANRVLPLGDEIVVRAAHVYGDLHQRGALISDADILIAASALMHELVLASNNEQHFQRIPGLTLDNWLAT